MSTTIVKFKLRRDTASNLTNVILSEGEPGYSTDTKILKVGDGVTRWSLLPASTAPIGANGNILYSNNNALTSSSNLSFINNAYTPIVGGKLTVSGNVEVTGNADETGSLTAQYLTLPDLTSKVETYLWGDKNTLLWQPFVNPGGDVKETDVLGWTTKLRQTDEVTLLGTGASTAEIVRLLNSLITSLANRGIIYRPPLQPAQTVTSVILLDTSTSTIAKESTHTPFTGNSNNEVKTVFSSTSNIWSIVLPNLDNISQIQSIEVIYNATISINPYSSAFQSDCRFLLSNQDKYAVFYAYNSFISENPTAGTRNIGVTTSHYITDQDFFKLAIGNTDGTIDKTKGINFSWYIGYASTYITACNVTKIVINYV